MEPEITDYIKEAKGYGHSDDEIKKHLKDAGWTDEVIEKNFSIALSVGTEKDLKTTDSVVPAQQTPGDPHLSNVLLNTTTQVAPPVAKLPDMPNGKRFSLILKCIGIVVVVLIAVAIIVFYLLVLRGKTVAGVNLLDKTWYKMVDTGLNRLAERELEVSYNDPNEFTMTRNHWVRIVGEEGVNEAVDRGGFFSDVLKGFSLNNLHFKSGVGGYVNITERSNPKAEGFLNANLSLNSKTYTYNSEGRLTDLVGYFKYSFNDTIDHLLQKYGSEEGELLEVREWKDKWLKFTSTEVKGEEISDAIDFLDSIHKDQVESRDVARYRKAVEARAALENFKNTFGGYPKSQNDFPADLLDTVSSYQRQTYESQFKEVLPTDGVCTDWANKPHYYTNGNTKRVSGPNGKQIEVYTDFEYIFCLGKELKYVDYSTGDPTEIVLKAGMNKVSSNKSISETVCPSGQVCLLSIERVNPFKEILKNNRPFDIQSFRGLRKVNDVWTFHYKMELNKQKLRTIFVESIKQAVGEEEFNRDEKTRDIFLKVLDTLLERWEVKNFEVWSGVANRQLYRLHLTTNALSVIETTEMVMTEILPDLLRQFRWYEGTTGPDGKRFADMNALSTALELYYGDYGGYPPALRGEPVGLVPKYISELPKSPEPASGRCSDFYNPYWYIAKGEAVDTVGNQKVKTKTHPSYTYSFCVGKQTEQFPDGILILSETGIKSLDICPPGRQCYKDGALPDTSQVEEPKSEDELVNFFIDALKKLPFNAEVKVRFDAKNYDKVKGIEVPSGAIDFFSTQSQSSLPQSLDAQRLSQVRMIASALELYFNDNNQYPESITTLVPKYINSLPAAPVPPGGKCTAEENAYVYKRKTSQNYTMSFCLGGQTGGYSAGSHSLTESGIY